MSPQNSLLVNTFSFQYLLTWMLQRFLLVPKTKNIVKTWSFFIRHSNLDPYIDVIEVFMKELVRWYGKLSLNILTPCSILVLVSVSMYSRHPISHCPVVSDLKTVKFSLFVSNVVSTWKVLGFSSKSWAFIDAELEPVTRQLLSSFSVIRMLNLQPV